MAHLLQALYHHLLDFDFTKGLLDAFPEGGNTTEKQPMEPIMNPCGFCIPNFVFSDEEWLDQTEKQVLHKFH